MKVSEKTSMSLVRDEAPVRRMATGCAAMVARSRNCPQIAASGFA
jgi:hypothetical protein